MWAIDNHTPYKVESTWGRNKEGVHEWIVAAKGTFDILPDGHVELADEQMEPLIVPEYSGEPGLSSLRYDADLVGPKPTTDVILNATAHAPGQRPSTDFHAGFRIGSIKKVIRVVGERWWIKGLHGVNPTSPKPVLTLPIVYERAFGGYDSTDPDPKKHRLDTCNPVGCGVTLRSKSLENQSLPNFEYPKGNIRKKGPAGFGALDCFWSPRRELAGTYDKAWEQNRRPLLPDDWSPSALLCSPRDQLPKTHLRGGESVELINLTPEGSLHFALPKMILTFRTNINGSEKEHPGKLSTVIIEPDYPRVILVWQSTLVCPSDVDYLEETVVREIT